MKGFFRLGNPFIPLIIKGRKFESLLDTGFNGHVMLPASVINRLGLEQIGISDYLTASGEDSLAKVYSAKISFLGEETEVPVLETKADFSLAGMELFHDCRILIERSKDVVEVSKTKAG